MPEPLAAESGYEYSGPETIEEGAEYMATIRAKLRPIPIVSIPVALLIDALNKGEEKLKEEMDKAGYEIEVTWKDKGWVWEIPNISVKELWWKYKFIVKKVRAAVKGIPAILYAVAMAIFAIIGFIIGAFLIGWGLELVRLSPLVGKATVGVIILVIAALGIGMAYTLIKRPEVVPKAIARGVAEIRKRI